MPETVTTTAPAPSPATSTGVSRRWIIAILALGGFGIGTTEFVAMGLLPNIANALQVSEPDAGHVISAYALGVVVGAPLIAALTASMSRRTLLIALMVAFTVGNLATVLAPTYDTVIVSRFIAGLPHGAYFGVAALVAAHLAAPQHRAKAVAQVMLGLPLANVLGVPVATWLGEAFGWRIAFVITVAIGVAAVVALVHSLPALSQMRATNPLTELGALRRTQVWLTLLIGIVGFGGMFAFFTYLNSTLTGLSGLDVKVVPVALMLFGIGMVLGNLIGGYLADRSVPLGILSGLVAIIVSLVSFALFADRGWVALALTFAVGVSGSTLVPALQTRLMDVAEDAQTLAAALNHSALNIANAAGAWLGGMVIAAGYGYRSPAVLGAGLAVAGIVVLGVTLLAAARAKTASAARMPREAGDTTVVSTS